MSPSSSQSCSAGTHRTSSVTWSAASAGHASRQLAAALARLSAELRDTILLAAWGDLSYVQVAVALGVPIGTVRSRLSRARWPGRCRVRAARNLPERELGDHPGRVGLQLSGAGRLGTLERLAELRYSVHGDRGADDHAGLRAG